ncbi:hypothetical protein R1sor_005263 [Riccia sorocarpa]|uniref:Uncharacterized protein n=1 Tax=Riccia sorocarpa TaxID=122646 RepID=A0ABD3HM11_9MARC
MRAWILLGDFNMITEEQDQAGGSPGGLVAVEKESWEALTTELRLVDKFERREGQSWFTWDNMYNRRTYCSDSSADKEVLSSGSEEAVQAEGTEEGRILKRLDRVYVGEELVDKVTKYEIRESTNISDHVPVHMCITDGSNTEKSRGRYCMNKKLEKEGLLDEDGQVVQGKNEMCDLARKHFQKLLQEDRNEEDRLADTICILGKIYRTLSEKEKQELYVPFTEEELKGAAKEMKNG